MPLQWGPLVWPVLGTSSVVAAVPPGMRGASNPEGRAQVPSARQAEPALAGSWPLPCEGRDSDAGDSHRVSHRPHDYFTAASGAPSFPRT